MVRDAAEKASNASHGDSEGDRNGEQISRPGGNAEPAFLEFDRHGPAQQPADDSFPAWPENPRTVDQGHRVFQPAQDFAAYRRAQDRSNNDGIALRLGQYIAVSRASQTIERESDGVRQRFENEVRRNGNDAEMKNQFRNSHALSIRYGHLRAGPKAVDQALE